MPSPNLDIAHVAANQNQKEVTVNDAIDALDRALTDTAFVDFSAGPVTLTDAAFRTAVVFRPAAALAGPASLAVPAIRRLFWVMNTDATHAITVHRGSTSITLPPGAALGLCTDGTDDGLFATGATPAAAVYDFGMLQAATPTPGAVMGKVVMPRALILPSDFAGSVGHVDTPPDAALWTFSVTRNAVEIGWVTISDAGAFGFATLGGAPVTVAPGDVIRFLADPADAPAEVSIAGIALTLAAELA